MRKLAILSGLALWCVSAIGQSTLTPKESAATPPEPNELVPEEQPIYNKIMLVPFEPKMYMSDIDRDIAANTGLRSYQIRENFRHGLNNIVFMEAKQHLNTVSLLGDEPEVQKDLFYMYQSMGYHYRPMPQDAEPEQQMTPTQRTVAKLTDFVRKPAEKPKEEPGTVVKDGQLYSINETQERYMATKVINPNMLKFIANKYECDLFLFINQLDIKQAAESNHLKIENNDHKREVKVHYTIMDRSGNEVYGGAAKVWFSARTNDMNKIIKGHFPVVARQICTNLPAPELSRAEVQKKKEEEAQAGKQDILKY